MDIQPFLGPPATLLQWLDSCVANPGQQHWLLFKDPHGNTEVTLATEMYPILGDDDFSPEEFDEFEESIHPCGYSNFLNLDQLEDIICNLAMQKENYSRAELLYAVNYYFSHDAFVVVSEGTVS
ncbi:DUF7716 domain-containing protein [Bacterioplanoides pacificum]|uniref:DUF7716 domain-containing protein n=1 Tax=Bacterioplanoides pacificum TaxID=1171596 RepID=A0ABV7VNJ6_9GAMM